MSTDYFGMQKLLKKLDELKYSLESTGGAWTTNYLLIKWSPFWEMAKEIQNEFNSGLSVSREDRAKLWEEFNKLRNSAKESSDKNYENFSTQSESYRNAILSDCDGLSYPGWEDWQCKISGMDFKKRAIEVKERSRKLGLVMKRLSENKLFMTGPHKKKCFEEIQKVKDSHDKFWGVYKEHQQKQQSDFRERVQANIDSNRKKLEKAKGFLENQQQIVNECERKLLEKNSVKWQAIFEERLDQAREKIRSAEEQISRFEAWIKEEEERLSNAR